MNTTTITRPAPTPTKTTDHESWTRRILGVVIKPRSYRSIGYMLLGLPLGTIWFSVIVTGVAVGISMLVVALLGIPLLLGMWYVTRACANAERVTANALLDQHLPIAPMASPGGSVWVRLRSMSGDRDRWREVAFLLLRFPVGIATFTAAVTAIATPAAVAYAPFSGRTSSPWAWLLIPLGGALLIAAFHLMNALANACGRWAKAWLAAGGDVL